MTGRTRAKLRFAWNTNDGGKGVIAEIRPDAEMPTTVGGERAELVVNSLGVVNRLNPAQLYECELNFLAGKVATAMRADPTPEEAYERMMTFLEMTSPAQAAWMRANVGPDDARAMVEEVVTGWEPIFIHQPPFHGVISLEGLHETYARLGIERDRFVGIEEPMVLGWNYYIKLRHEPTGKFSARSAKHLSIGGVPTKNSRGIRGNTEHHSSTPIRLGEQELQNLLIANEPDELQRLLRLYATDDVSREGMIADLLLRQDPFSVERIEPRGSGVTRPVAGLRALFEAIGLRLENTPEEDHE
jgi:hypothetical protein